MAEYMKLVRAHHIRKMDERLLTRSFSWKKLLRDAERDIEAFVPANAFNTNLTVNFNDACKDRIVFETVVSDYDEICNGVQVRWFAIVLKVCGYRVLAQYVGCTEKFWIHFLSDTVFPLTDAAQKDEQMSSVVYAPPRSVNREYVDGDMKKFIKKSIEDSVVGELCLSTSYETSKLELIQPRFSVGQRLELLNYAYSTEIRVARIQEICGRRMNVLVMEKDYPEAIPDPSEDRQMYGRKNQYWIDQESVLIFPVGFAAYNNYKLCAKPDYVEHTKNIAEALERGESPDYHPDDVSFDDLYRVPVDKSQWELVKVGQKFELIDPLAQSFKNLKVATVLALLKSDGYLVIGVDGPDQNAECFPVHITNVFMFPIGYGAQWDLEVCAPDDYEKKFDWDVYLTEKNATPLPVDVFRPMPPKERLKKFQIGMHLEAADMCENQFICPATIKSIHGRIINVNYDGWDSEFDELYDIDSHDILPVGWCELHNYVLQQPKTDDY